MQNLSGEPFESGPYHTQNGFGNWSVHHLNDASVGRRIILRWIFRKWNVGYGLDLAGST
jgi:hypothetical protein